MSRRHEGRESGRTERCRNVESYRQKDGSSERARKKWGEGKKESRRESRREGNREGTK